MAPASLSTVESSARGRDANTAYLYERIAEGDHEHAEQPDSPHVMRRGTSHDAAQLVRGIIAARDDRARTAHQVAASTDREDPTARRWWWSIWPIPMLFGGRRMGRAMLAHQIRGVYAMPVVVAGRYVGALDLFRTHPGVLGAEQLAGALVAAELAQMPLLDLLAEDLQAAVADPDSDSWAELNTLSRAEVSQATGMLVAQLEVEPAEALVRLRAHAFATGRSATDVACDILDRRLRLQAD